MDEGNLELVRAGGGIRTCIGDSGRANDGYSGFKTQPMGDQLLICAGSELWPARFNILVKVIPNLKIMRVDCLVHVDTKHSSDFPSHHISSIPCLATVDIRLF